uniref:Transposase (Putative), gypsy type n=1 Tax=Tanacetum cinerariifolium TaxID=118510 RepID=A0A699H7B2_TANCI|nr:hypothetical protein [Tanacetum cinerariifolium]
MDLFNLIRAPNPTKVKIGTRPRAAHEVPLLTVTVSRVIEMEDTVAATDSSGIPSTIERLPLDFANENPSQQSTRGDGTEDQDQETVAPEVPSPENVTTTGVAPETGLVEEIFAMGPRETPADVSDPEPLSFANPQSIPKQDVVQSSKGADVAEDPESENTSFTFMVGSPESIYQPEWGKSVAQVARRDQRIQARENEIKNIEALLEAETDMKKAAEAKNAELVKELENLRAQFTDLQVSNDRLSQQVSTLQAQVTVEEKIKAAFEEFIKYEDDQVEKCCAKMDARLDALSIDFDEELYPHMLTAIAGRRWVIGHGLCLTVMRCGESTELRQVFPDVVSAGIAKGMSEGLKYGVEHGKANLDLEVIEAYDPDADTKYVAAIHALRDLKYPVVDQLESLKDAPIDVIMASLHLESDFGEDAPQWIRELRPSSSQLKIPVYPEVRDLKDPWSFKEEILLEDAIAANVSRAEKKKKFRVVFRTHGVGFAHHARSDGVPVSVPTVAPQGLAILLEDASKQMKTFEDGASPRLLRGSASGVAWSRVKDPGFSGGQDMDLVNLIRAPNPTKVKIGTHPRAAHEVPVLTVTASRVMEMKDPTATTESSGTPHHRKGHRWTLRMKTPLNNLLVVTERKTKSTIRGKCIAPMGLETGSTFPVPTPQETPADVSDPDPLSFAKPQSVPKQDVIFQGTAVAGDPELEITSFTFMVGSPESIYQPEWGMTNGYRLDTPEACQDLVDYIAPLGYFSEMRHLHNDDFLSQYNINLARQVAMGSQLWFRFEQEAKLLKKSVSQVARRDQRIQARENEIKNLVALLEAETDMKKAAEAKNTELVKELENLRAQFTDILVSNDRLSQQAFTLQAQVIGEEKLKSAFKEFKNMKMTGWRSVVQKWMRVFTDVVSAGIDKGMSEGLKYRVEHGKANLDLEAIEAYDPEADTKYVEALHALRGLKYPVVDQLKSLKDAPIDVIMTSLHLGSDYGEDALQWIRELRPSSSQLKIPMYPKVRDLKDPCSFKEEILLEDAISANVSRLAILLADTATQTETSENEASPRLLRSKSLPAMYNLDWP